LKDTLHRRSYT